MKTANATNPALILNYGKTTVPFENITYLKSESGNYTKFFLKSKSSLLTAFTLKHYAQKLSEQRAFISPRKGVMVNKSYIKRIDRHADGVYLVLFSGEKFKISRRRITDVLNSFAA